jgi:hypothetical protein
MEIKEPFMGASRKNILLLGLLLTAFIAVYLLSVLLRPTTNNTVAGVALAQGPDATEIGVAPPGRTALEFTSRIDQEGATFRLYGYVTHLHNLPAGLLFTHPISHSEATARILMSGTTTLVERTVLSNVFHIDSVGELTFYFDEDEGASFDDLASFGRGVPIGSATMRIQNVLTVIGPNTGITDGSGELVHTTAIPFVLDGVEYQLGRPGMIERVTFAGGGVRFVPDPPVAIIAVGGAGTVAGFDTNVPFVKK